jgi:MFS family permease
MTAVTLSPEQHTTDDRLARRNALVLAAAQALGTANNIVIAATASIVGEMLAPNKWLITVPLSIQVLGIWQGTLPMGALARRFGRQAAFQTGACCGVLAGLLCCLAVVNGSFALLCVGTFFSGLYASVHQTYRFAAADTASEGFRARAISWVMVGGVGAAFLGPGLVLLTQDWWPQYLFAASYIGQALLAVVAMGVLATVKVPPPLAPAQRAAGRPLRDIFRQPRLIAAVVCGVASYAMMNLVMTGAPLAMVMCKHSTSDATLGIQWHVLGMYVPSFFTGTLIARFGVERITILGLILLALAAAIGISGTTVAHFWIGLMVLGVGWNFGFIGATTMVTECHRPEERTTVQSLNDFCIFGSMALGSFASGTVLATEGWVALNLIVFPSVVIAGALLVWLGSRQRARLA